MTNPESIAAGQRRGAVPLRRGRCLAPSLVFIRHLLTGSDAKASVIRDATPVVMGMVAHLDHTDGELDYTQPIGATLPEIADFVGIAGPRVDAACAAMVEVGALLEVGRELHLAAQVLTESGVIAELDVSGCRRALDQPDVQIAPALAVLYEVAALSPFDPPASGPVSLTVSKLAGQIGYGIRSVRGAISNLQATGLIERERDDQVALSLTPAAFDTTLLRQPKGRTRRQQSATARDHEARSERAAGMPDVPEGYKAIFAGGEWTVVPPGYQTVFNGTKTVVVPDGFEGKVNPESGEITFGR
jgi:DNA-binding transcriptional ArsR family regulator